MSQDLLGNRVSPVVDTWTIPALVRALSQRGNRPAVISVDGDEARETGSATLAQEVLRLASGLRREGITHNEPVALFGPNSVDWIVVRLALATCGALVVAIDDLSTDTEVGVILKASGCRRIFCAARHVERVQSAAADGAIDVYSLDRKPGEARHWRDLMAEAAEELPGVDSDEPTMLIYTSGTTGVPKGFTLSTRNIAANVRALVAEEVVGASDRLLLPLPLHHAYPQVVGLFTPLTCGSTIVLPESPTGPHIVAALAATSVTGIVGVPRLYSALVAGVASQVAARGRLAAAMFKAMLGVSIAIRRRFGLNTGFWLLRPVRKRLGANLRLLVSGGAKLEPKILWSLVGLGFEVRSGYGLAETASIFTGNLPKNERLGSEGKALGEGKVRISDPDAEGTGEIELKGPSVFSGYVDMPELNEAIFTPDGWFRTGDLGHMDEDGFVYVTGRSKEMIVLGGGKNVFPEELEKIYAASPYIEEIAVLERNGALVGLIVPDVDAIRKDGFTRIDDVLRVALKDAAHDLPSFQRLAGFAIADGELPRTRLGKYRRFMLPEAYEHALTSKRSTKPVELTEADKALLGQPRAAAVLRLISERRRLPHIALDADLELDLGIDSLEWMALSLELENKLGVRVSDESMAGVSTVREFMKLVAGTEQAPEVEVPVDESSGGLGDQAAWLEPPGAVTNTATRCLFAVNKVLMRLLFGVRTSEFGGDIGHGPLVIAANHASDVDPLVVAAALPWRIACRVHWGGDADRVFGARWAHPILRAAHVFPVDGKRPKLSLSMAADVLKRGDTLVWFPEEWRSPTGELQSFQPGIGWLLAEVDATVVPAWIEGAFDALPRQRKWPRLRQIKVSFGTPVSSGTLAGGHGERRDPDRIVAALHAAIAEVRDTFRAG